MIGMKNELRNKTHFGIFVKIPSIEVIEMIAASGFDFILIDMEHTPLTYRDVQMLISVAQGHGLKVIVRTRDFRKGSILCALDLGADGVQIPQVDNKEDALQIVQQTKYPPIGERGIAFSNRASKYGFMDSKNYIQQSNNNILVSVHIETKKGLDNIEEIANTDGIDLLFLGPTDLSYSLGVDSDYMNGGLKEAFFEIKNHVLKADKQMGIIINNQSKLEFCLANNIRYIIWDTDIGLFKKQLMSVVEIIKKVK